MDGYSTNDMKVIVDELVDLSTRLRTNEAPERKGGYVTICLGGDGVSTVSYDIGLTPEDKNPVVFRAFSREKLFRAYADWFRDPTILSSWSTRNESMKRYGGAVLINISELDPTKDRLARNPGGISFSGLKEHVDEAVALTTARKFDLVTPEQADKIVEVSQNKVWPEMMKAYNLKIE